GDAGRAVRQIVGLADHLELDLLAVEHGPVERLEDRHARRLVVGLELGPGRSAALRGRRARPGAAGRPARARIDAHEHALARGRRRPAAVAVVAGRDVDVAAL